MTPVLIRSLGFAALTALFASWIFTWMFRGLAHRLGIVDRPGERKIHQKPVAYLGGMALWGGMLSGFAVFSYLAPDMAFLVNFSIHAVLLGGLMVCALGLLDDVRGLGAISKLLFEIALGAFMWLHGFRVERLTLPTGRTLDLGDLLPAAAGIRGWMDSGIGSLIVSNPEVAAAVGLSLAITIAWYALLMNAINLIDGLDGLAAGISLISAAFVTLVALVSPDLPSVAVLLIGCLLVAVTLGFLCFNWHPASIFMGDTGALLLGYLLASISLLSSTKSQTLLTLLVPLLAVGLPVIESVHSFFRRALKGEHPFRADRRHLHHRLLDLGFSHSRAVLILLYLTLLLGMMAFLLATANTAATVMFTFVILTVGFLLLMENLNFLERLQSVARPNDPPAPRSAGKRKAKSR